MSSTNSLNIKYLQSRTKEILIMLYVTFFFGMFINLFAGDATNRPWYAHVGLGIHMLLALLLLIGSIVLFKNALKSREDIWAKKAIYGFFSIVIAILGGFVTTGLKDLGAELGSFIMAIAFIVAFICYIKLYYRLKSMGGV